MCLLLHDSNPATDEQNMIDVSFLAMSRKVKLFMNTQELLSLPDSQSNTYASLHIFHMHYIILNRSLLYPLVFVFMQLFQLVFAGP